MFKIDRVNLGGPTPNIAHVINGIETTEEVVTIPVYIQDGYTSETVKRIGYLEIKTEDTRSDYERWKDEYYYSYYPTPTIVEVEVSVSPCVKKIIIPHSVEQISKRAFQYLKDVIFEIDENNYNYKVEKGAIVHKHTGEVIWPYTK